MELPKSEEQLMNHLWVLGEAFMKDLIAAYPDPKPAASTIATHLKRLQNKQAVGYKTYGSVRAYYPLISKQTYFSGRFRRTLKTFFGGSVAQFASFFAKDSDLTDEELETLRHMIEQQIEDRKK
ncbi:MAG: BlaI/MecI/CopY family transcriptional regulator [Bacteroidota bacterium]